MSKPANLTLILAKGAFKVLPELQDATLRSWLERAAGRGAFGSIRREAPQDHLDFELQLLAAVGLLAEAKTLASAPVCLAAESASGFWLRAEPIHFAAGMTRIDAVTLRGAAAVSADERAQLSQAIGNHLCASHLRWDASRWLIGYTRDLNVQTREPNSAADLGDAMPSGADAQEVRRLMTELQMVMHEHPVNVRRERLGLPAANAVWVWGGGSVIAQRRNSTAANSGANDSSASGATIFATDPFSLGLASITGSPAITPIDPEQVLSNSVGVNAAIVLDLQEDDNLLERWLRPLQTALAKGRLQSLVIAIDQWTVELTRGSRWRFWRGGVPLERWSVA